MTNHRCVLALTAVLAASAAVSAAEVRGVVARFDPDKKELVLEQRGRGLRGTLLLFTLPDQTQVLYGDQPGALSDVEVGRRVRVEYETTDGQRMVQAIHLLGGPRPAGTATSAPTPPPAADSLTGVLRRVGYSDREVTVIGPGAKGAQTETTVAVPESARVMKNGKEETLDDLKEGDAATVLLEKKEGPPSAASITVGPGGAAAGEKKNNPAIPKLRRLLKIADQILQGMEKKNGP